MFSSVFSNIEKENIRNNFPHISNGVIYLNHAAVSPLSAIVNQSLQHFLAERNSGIVENFENWMQMVQETRSMISQIIHADDANNITFLGNTSEAISAVAEGFDWSEGDEIILNTLEFPANIQPFRILENRGVRLIYVEPDENGIIQPAALEHVITDHTKMLSISAVQYLTGLKPDLKSIGEICKKHGVFFVVDGIQALGATDIDVEKYGIDALATGCHKWLMAPMGTGFLYLSEKLQNSLSPYKTGWLSVENPWNLTNFDQDWRPISKHLEVGTFNMMGITGLNASLSNFIRIGTKKIYQEISGLGNYLYETLGRHQSVQLVTPGDAAYRAGIITFSVDGIEDTDYIVQDLKTRKKIMISSREGRFRISAHYYNTREEIDSVLSELLDR